VRIYAHPSEYWLEGFGTEYAPRPNHKCPTCSSPAPHLHPAIAFEGEVQPCGDPYHLIHTNENRAALEPPRASEEKE
jgi:hypothetical protein